MVNPGGPVVVELSADEAFLVGPATFVADVDVPDVPAGGASEPAGAARA